MVGVGSGVCASLVGVGVAGISVGAGWEVAGTVVAVEAGDESPPQAAMTASAARMPSRKAADLSTGTYLLPTWYAAVGGHCAALSVALS